MRCAYCNQPRANLEGWHENCPQSADAKARIDSMIENMSRQAEGGRQAPVRAIGDLAVGREIRNMKAWEQDNGRDN